MKMKGILDMQLVTARSSFPPQLQNLVRAVNRHRALSGNVTVGRGPRIGRKVVIFGPHSLVLGDWVSVGPYTTIQANGEIGDFALIGMHVQIAGRRDHATDEIGRPMCLATWIGDRDGEATDAVSIGRDVWVGGRATILGGVSIGQGAIVGAGSVVTADVPAFAIAVGNPARVVGSRFSAEDQEAHVAGLDALALELKGSQ